jgi:hypothetical protein
MDAMLEGVLLVGWGGAPVVIDINACITALCHRAVTPPPCRAVLLTMVDRWLTPLATPTLI